MSRLFPVTVRHQVGDWSKGEFDIEPSVDPEQYELVLYLPNAVPAIVATCESARVLSEWALDKGAKSVRWGFDLAIVERRNR